MIVTMRRTKDTTGYSIRNWNTRVAEKSARISHTLALAFKYKARANCPRRTGRLQDSIGNPAKEGIWDLSEKGLRIRVGTNVPYAIPIEMGVNHEWNIPIMPKTKPGDYLIFYWPKIGKWCFARQVTHPAMKGKFFMKRAAAEVRRDARNIISSVI